jgi:hypothetical protein
MEPFKTHFLISVMFVINTVSSTTQRNTLRVVIVKADDDLSKRLHLHWSQELKQQFAIAVKLIPVSADSSTLNAAKRSGVNLLNGGGWWEGVKHTE